jgi:hypothetical protein
MEYTGSRLCPRAKWRRMPPSWTLSWPVWRAEGWEVKRLSADALPPRAPRAAGVLHMAQGPEALGILEEWERNGLCLVNSPQAVRRCYRRYLFAILAEQGLAYPPTRFYHVVEAQESWRAEFPGPGWLKRAEVHAETQGDVRRVATRAEAYQVLADFRHRGIDCLIWQKHVPGREVKFYGVGPGLFFRAYADEGTVSVGLCPVFGYLETIGRTGGPSDRGWQFSAEMPLSPQKGSRYLLT